MLTVHGGLLFWTIVTFLILLVVLKKIAWGPIIAALESREKEIKEALDSAAIAKADAEKATSDYEKIRQEAQSEAQKILTDAKSVKEKMISDAVLEAKTKADAETNAALEVIASEKEKAVKEIRTTVVDLSIKAASKLIDKNLDSNDNKKLINDTIDEIGST